MTLLEALQNPQAISSGELKTEALTLRWSGSGIILHKKDRPPVSLAESAIATLQLSRSEQEGKRTAWQWLLRRPPSLVHRLHAELRGRAIGRIRLYADTLQSSLLEGLPSLEQSGVVCELKSLRALLRATRIHGAEIARALDIPGHASAPLPVDVPGFSKDENDVLKPIRASAEDVEAGEQTEPYGSMIYGFRGPAGDTGVIYQDIMRFRFGRAAVRLNSGFWGYIDPRGEEVIPARFNTAFFFNEEGVAEAILGRALVEIDAAGRLIRTVGRVETSAKLPRPPAGLPELYDVSKFVPSQKPDRKDEIKRGETFSAFKDAETGRFGFVSEECGTIEARFNDVDAFSSGRAAVRSPTHDLWGYIDTYGRLVVPYQFTSALRFNAAGRAEAFQPNGTRVIVDSDGNVEIPG